MDYNLLARFFKFGLVGFISFVIDFGITYFLKEKLKINKFVSNALAYCVAVVVNFTLNRLWTFQSASNDVGAQFLKFFAFASIALILNTIIIYILNVKIRLNFYLSKFIAVLIVMFYNYSMNAMFTFANDIR